MAHQTGESQWPALLKALVPQAHYHVCLSFTFIPERIKEALLEGNHIKTLTNLEGSKISWRMGIFTMMGSNDQKVNPGVSVKVIYCVIQMLENLGS